MSQAEDRAHRISQQNCVSVYYLYGPDTVDDIIYKMLAYKTEIIADSLDGGRFARQYQISKVSQDDVIEDVKTRKEEGKLNPVIKDLRKEKTIDEFASGGNLNNFVKRESKRAGSKQTSRRGRKRLADEYEEIEDSSAVQSKDKPVFNEPCPSMLQELQDLMPSKPKQVQSKLNFRSMTKKKEELK